MSKRKNKFLIVFNFSFFTLFRKHGYDVNKFDIFFLMSRIDRDRDGIINFHNDYKDLFFNDYFKVFKRSDLEKDSSNKNQRMKSTNKTKAALYTGSIRTTSARSSKSIDFKGGSQKCEPFLFKKKLKFLLLWFHFFYINLINFKNGILK